jgi:hypothetical protein
MDDRFLDEMRREPRPEFARELHERLRRQGPATRPARAWRPLQVGVSLAGGLVVALVVLCFTVPAMRASAQAFLDLFRVRNFVAVSVDPARMERLRDKSLGLESLLDQQTETLEKPGPPKVVASAQEAAALAGFSVLVPAKPPEGFAPDTIAVGGNGAARFTVNTERLGRLLETLDIRDLKIPADLDGRSVTVRTTAAVFQRFVRDRRHVVFVQARSPEVSLPAGIDLAQLGEIALRVAGLDPAEARRFARSIDWHSTLVVPVPIGASSFSEVSVRGQRGLLVTVTEEGKSPGQHHHPGNLLLWSEGDMVYALDGNVDRVSLIEMAESLR